MSDAGFCFGAYSCMSARIPRRGASLEARYSVCASCATTTSQSPRASSRYDDRSRGSSRTYWR